MVTKAKVNSTPKAKATGLAFGQLPAYIERKSDLHWATRLTDYFPNETPALKKLRLDKNFTDGRRDVQEIAGWQVQEIGSYQPPADKRTHYLPSLRRIVLAVKVGESLPTLAELDEDEEDEE